MVSRRDALQESPERAGTLLALLRDLELEIEQTPAHSVDRERLEAEAAALREACAHAADAPRVSLGLPELA